MGSVGDREQVDVAIVGGGIGGLALAIGLQQHGHIRTDIYEAAFKFSEIGAGVFFGANAIRAMSLIHPSVGEAYARISTTAGWESKEDTYFDFILAHELHGLPTGTPIISPKLSATERHSTAHRAHFVDELVKLIPKDMAHFGKRLIDLTRDETRGRTVMLFADGTTAEADAPVFTGKHAYRGLIPMDKAIAAIGEEKAQNRYMFIGKGGHVLTFPVANGKVMNVVAFSTTKSGVWEGEWIKRMEREDLEADFEGFGEECQKIFSLMESTDHWGIFDLSPNIPTYQSRDLRLVLLGDSAHACAPHQGAGAGQALEDAHILSHALGECRSPSDLLAAFDAYEAVRMPRARPDVGDDLEKLKAVIDVPIREIWNCDLSAELDKALAMMRAQLGRPALYIFSLSRPRRRSACYLGSSVTIPLSWAATTSTQDRSGNFWHFFSNYGMPSLWNEHSVLHSDAVQILFADYVVQLPKDAEALNARFRHFGEFFIPVQHSSVSEHGDHACNVTLMVLHLPLPNGLGYYLASLNPLLPVGRHNQVSSLQEFQNPCFCLLFYGFAATQVPLLSFVKLALSHEARGRN
ncbi:hypothetical protein MKX07_003097 [Trichoderma sp. CBMAI-0711]|nr:hypothetical protein MKX07_003097 [Trichoderma sp. CBMAI-0711]